MPVSTTNEPKDIKTITIYTVIEWQTIYITIQIIIYQTIITIEEYINIIKNKVYGYGV